MNNLIYTMSIMETLEKWSEKLKAWIMDNYGNPVLWVGILVVGIIFFKAMFSALNKD